jgi:putative ABC transport system permease protein
MIFWTILKVALRSLFANKLRTLLSMLGIIIGVAAVISMLALGAGAQKQVLSDIQSMGTNLLVVRSGQAGMRGVSQGNIDSLTLQDAEALLQKVPEVLAVAPVVGGSAQIKALNKNVRTSITGASITYFDIRDFKVQAGRPFTEAEVNANARVALLGPVTVENLFGNQDPIGQTVKLKGINFKVIGVLQSKGDQGWANPDDQAIIPYTTAMKQVLGLEYLREIDLQIDPNADINQAQDAASTILQKTHRLQPDEPEDFNIRNQAEIIQTASNFTRIFTVLLGGIASISLLVGGIGIMNIMLVTVTERTREIGVRKAIGARNRDILLQFLLESTLLSCTGGLLGVLLGILAAVLIGKFSPIPAEIQLPSILLAFSFAAGVGIFFGFYPASRAASLNPIEALRFE